MKKLILLSLFLVISSCNNSVKKEDNSTSEEKNISKIPIDDTETTYYLIRHAEKDRSDVSNNDPGLTKKGVERAKYWATYFSDKNINQIYSTDYNRTQLTSYFVSIDYNVAVQSYVPNELYTEDFKLITKGENILIVGHSNTTPQLVNKIIGAQKYTDMDDRDNSSLFVVKVKGNNKTSEIIKIEIQ